MKFVSWNVNGLRACYKKGFEDFFKLMDADIFAIQETKMNEKQFEESISNYHLYWNNAQKAGYSGTLVLTKKEPLNVYRDFEKINLGLHNTEGRILTLEFVDFYFVNVYVPNSQRELTRLDYRQEFDADFKQYLNELKQTKRVIVCGDFNVAHQPIDLKNPTSNQKNAGFTIEERLDFSNLLESGFIDTFRSIHKDEIKYSWWSYMFDSRNRNIGWRIDYFLISTNSEQKIIKADIRDEVLGSDHAPIELEVEW